MSAPRATGRGAGFGIARDLAILAVASVLACLPLITNPALPLGSDVYSTNHYLQGFVKAFSEGDLYPRWTDQTNRFLGAPSFIMFVPLPYYLAGTAAWLAGTWVGGFKIFFLVVCFFTAGSFYPLAHWVSGRGGAAAIASAIYLLLPYHSLDMYQRFAISETVAFIFAPWILYCVARIDAHRLFFAGAACSYAALIYTHLISAYMMTLLLAVWIPWTRGLSPRRLVPIGAALACGLMLAGPALLPAFMEKDDANMAWKREMPNGDFRRNFIFSDEVIPGLGFKDPVKPPVLRAAHAQLLIAGIAAWIALGGAARGADRTRDLVPIAGCSGLAYLIQTPISRPVWHLVPELPTIQFPWRFQAIQCLLAALLVAAALARVRAGGMKRAARRAGAVALALAAAVNLALAWQNAYLKPFTFTDDVAADPAVAGWVEPAFTPVQFTGYRRFRESGPQIARAGFLQGEGAVEVESWASSRFRIRVDTPTGGRVGVRSFWFPGWVATIDGEPVPVEPATDYAIKSVAVPPGTHTIEMRFGPTPARRAGTFCAIAGILAVLGVTIRPRMLLSAPAASRGGA